MRDTTKLEQHIETHPTDANAKIALVKIKSDEATKLFELEATRKREKLLAIQRKRLLSSVK